MALQKSEAIVLHSRKQGETSKLLTLYTRHQGLLSMIAKGSRGLKSRYWGTLELFNHIDCLYYFKEAREIQFISQASIIKAFRTLQEEPAKMAIAATMCEIVEKAEVPGAVNPALFRLLLDFLGTLNKRNTGWRTILRICELKYLDLSGFRPELSRCSSCQNEEPTDNNYFVFKNGGYLCGRCLGDTSAGAWLSEKAITLLRWLQSTGIDPVSLPRVPQQIGQEVDRLIYEFMAFHLEGVEQLRAVRFWQGNRS